MSEDLLMKKAIEEAHKELQTAYGMLAEVLLDESLKLEKADFHLRRCNEWLYAVIAK